MLTAGAGTVRLRWGFTAGASPADVLKPLRPDPLGAASGLRYSIVPRLRHVCFPGARGPGPRGVSLARPFARENSVHCPGVAGDPLRPRQLRHAGHGHAHALASVVGGAVEGRVRLEGAA